MHTMHIKWLLAISLDIPVFFSKGKEPPIYINKMFSDNHKRDDIVNKNVLEN
jgi:hypothetical protein